MNATLLIACEQALGSFWGKNSEGKGKGGVPSPQFPARPKACSQATLLNSFNTGKKWGMDSPIAHCLQS